VVGVEAAGGSWGYLQRRGRRVDTRLMRTSLLTKILAAIACSSVLLASAASDASARVRTVPPGGTFRLANHAVIDQVRIKHGQVLRVRCIGDGCDWRRKHKPKILANISELDRIFRSFARVPLVVTIVRR
jgi:hypothetical protein